MLTAAALIAQQVAGKAVRDALFLSSFNVKTLPSVMIGSAVLGIATVLAFSRAMTVLPPAVLVPWAVGASGVLLMGEWALSLVAPRAAAVALYLHMAVFGATLVSGFWSLVNERFDPHTAKRVIGRIGIGASLGGVAGGVLAFGAARVVEVPTMLTVMAGMSALCVLGLQRLRPAAGSTSRQRAHPKESDPDRTGGALSGLRILREVPYLRDLALVVGLGALVEALLDYAFNAEAVGVFQGGTALMSFFALYHTMVGILALVLQTAVGVWSLRTIGLAGTVALKPAVVAAGGLLALASPRLWSTVLVRGAEAVLHNSLFRSGYELFYTPLPRERKRPTKSIVDVGFDRLGTVAGGVITLLVVAAIPSLSARALFLLAAAAACAALLITRRLHLGYVGALEQSLRSGAVHLDLGEVVDSTTRFTLAQTNLALDREVLLSQIQKLRGPRELESDSDDPATRTFGVLGDAQPPAVDPVVRAVAALESGDPAAVRRVLAASEALDPRLVPWLIPLLGRNDVFLDVLRALRRLAPRITGQLLDALLDPGQDPAVRRRVPRVLKGCPTQRAVDGLLLGLRDDRFEVRYQCGMALSRLKERNPVLSVPDPPVFAAVLAELKGTPPGGSAERSLEHVFTLLALVLEAEPLRISFFALRSDDAIRGTALEYLENVLPDTVRAALWPHVKSRRPAVPPRPAEQLKAELLRSSDSLVLQRPRNRRKDEGGEP
jgi:hypothetical protein